MQQSRKPTVRQVPPWSLFRAPAMMSENLGHKHRTPNNGGWSVGTGASCSQVAELLHKAIQNERNRHPTSNNVFLSSLVAVEGQSFGATIGRNFHQTLRLYKATQGLKVSCLHPTAFAQFSQSLEPRSVSCFPTAHIWVL